MFKAKLLCAYNQIERITDRYIYTIEVHELIQYYYRINYRPLYTGIWRKPAGYSATMYETREAAEEAARQDTWFSDGREWYITKEKNHTYMTKRHRYKRR